MTLEEQKADAFARRVIAMQLEETRQQKQAEAEYIRQMPEWTRKEVIEFQKGGRDGDTTHPLQ